MDDTLLLFCKVMKPVQPSGRSNEPPKLDDFHPSITPITPITPVAPFDHRFLRVSFQLTDIKHYTPKLPWTRCNEFPDRLPGRSLLAHQKMIALLITKLYIQYLQSHRSALEMISELNPLSGSSANVHSRIEAS